MPLYIYGGLTTIKPAWASGGGGGGTLLKPNNITNLYFWYDASDTSSITSSSGNVSQWNDKSVNGYNLSQSNVTNQPKTGTYTVNQLNVLDAVTNSSSFMKNTSIPFPNTYTLYAVGFCTGGWQRLIHGSATQDSLCLFGGGNNGSQTGYFELATGFGGAGWTSLATFPTITPIKSTTTAKQLYLFGGVVNNTSKKVCGWVNGSSVGIKVNISTGTGTGVVMGAGNTGGDIFVGFIGDIIMYNSELTEANRRKLEGYLAWKWGIQSSLPTSHLFYNSAPTTTSTGYSVSIPSGVTGGAPTYYYPFSSDTLNYATGAGVVDLQFVHTSTNADVAYSTSNFYADSGINGSLYCSNTGSSVWLQNINFSTTNGYTIMFWFNSTSTNLNMIWRSDYGYIFWNGSGGINVMFFSTITGTPINYFSINTWYHFTYVQPASSGKPYILINNNNKIVNSNNVTGSGTTTKSALFGDSTVSWVGAGMLGYINNFYLFNRELSAAEITAINNQ